MLYHLAWRHEHTRKPQFARIVAGQLTWTPKIADADKLSYVELRALARRLTGSKYLYSMASKGQG